MGQTEISQGSAKKDDDRYKKDEYDVDVFAGLTNGHDLHHVVALGNVGEPVDAAALLANLANVLTARSVVVWLELWSLQNYVIFRPLKQNSFCLTCII